MSGLAFVFTTVLNMSITASYAALGVILIRHLLLRRAPKVYSYALWLAVLVRLVTPVTFTAPFSIFGLLDAGARQEPGQLIYLPQQIGFMEQPAIHTGVSVINQAINPLLPGAEAANSVNPMQTAMAAASVVWAAGVAVLLAYSVYSYLKTMSTVRTATRIRDHIYETDRIRTPFVGGLIRPRIYVPLGLGEAELAYISAHEETHIRRRDYWIKPFAYFLVIVHWFNPIMWISFAGMSKDMEMSCDESVMKTMSAHAKQDYARSLLSHATGHFGWLKGSPLAFGESHVKSRIKNIMKFSEPRMWKVMAAAAVTAVTIVVFTANPKPLPALAKDAATDFEWTALHEKSNNALDRALIAFLEERERNEKPEEKLLSVMMTPSAVAALHHITDLGPAYIDEMVERIKADDFGSVTLVFALLQMTGWEDDPELQLASTSKESLRQWVTAFERKYASIQ